MVRIARIGVTAILAAAVSSAALAQTPTPDSAGSSPQVATLSDPNLAIATVTLKDGYRAKKLIGSSVYDAHQEKIGTLDDLIVTKDDKVVIAVISIGGFLGIGSKLVAVPYERLQFGQDNKVIMPDATKQQIDNMPKFAYSG